MKAEFEMDFRDPVLEVEGLRVSFATDEGRVTALEGIGFSVPRGACVALVGESGSGKSVTANAVMRLIQPPGRIDGGTIVLRSQREGRLEINGLRENDPRLYALRGGLMSMVFQEPMTALSPVHTIGSQILEAIHLHCRVSKKEAESMVVEILGRVGMEEPRRRLRQYPHEFSGGMRQRAVIAMALVTGPELLIADEPTTALDVTIQAQILRLIRSEQRRLGSSALFITHDMGVVAQVADYVCVMSHGRILEKGPVRAVLKTPRHPYTRGLLAALPGSVSPGSRLPTLQSVLGDEAFGQHHGPLALVGDHHFVATPV